MIQPTLAPVYLTDDIFITNGFFVNTASAAQTQSAYALAEWQVQREVGAYLQPTTVTGSFSWPRNNWQLTCPVGRLQSIDSVVLHQAYTSGVDRLISGTASIIDFDNGYFQVAQSMYDVSTCGGCGNVLPGDIFRAEIAYTSGFPGTGTWSMPNVTLAVCLAADIVLSMYYDRGMGIEYETFVQTMQIGRTIQTNLTRFVQSTPFGPSSRAQFIRSLLQGLKTERAGKLGGG